MNPIERSKSVVVVGAGAAGMVAAIHAAREGHRVVLLEKLSKIGTKLKATGGGRCNMTNTLDNESFMQHFGRDGRFMAPVLERFDSQKVIAFFREIGVESHAPDGYRVFPITHNASTILNALEKEMVQLGVKIYCSQKVISLQYQAKKITGVTTTTDTFETENVIIATGGKGYPTLGAEGDGYKLALSLGHTVTEIQPAMMPLKTKERWVAACTADTLPKVTMNVALKKYRKLKARGDLIFTKNGIRGPVVLDFSREITPLLSRYEEVPVSINMTKGMNETQIRTHFKKVLAKNPHQDTLTLLTTLLPHSVSLALCSLANAERHIGFNKQPGIVRERLVQLLVSTPLTVNGHDGFKMAMITRGGISLKEINPYTLQSKKIAGVYFCGEVMNLDGPCGGYNLQWSFASGYVAGALH